MSYGFNPIEYVEAKPINGYLTHAVANQPSFFHQSMPGLVITYHRALCGVGRGGMRVTLGAMGKPVPWVGIDGCDRCHTRLAKIQRDLLKVASL